jgi:hypothetical protein
MPVHYGVTSKPDSYNQVYPRLQAEFRAWYIQCLTLHKYRRRPAPSWGEDRQHFRFVLPVLAWFDPEVILTTLEYHNEY